MPKSRRFSSRTFSGRKGRRKPRRRAKEADRTSIPGSDDVDTSLLPEEFHADPYDDETQNDVPAMKKSWLTSVANWLQAFLASRNDPPTPALPSSTVATDPVRTILALPRGVARLDKFEEVLLQLTPGTPVHRSVAIAFHRELTSMASQAGVPLTILKPRVMACATALAGADRPALAGKLLRAIGERNRAAELFVSAAAIDELERLDFEVEVEEGGVRFESRMAFERFENFFSMGMRQKALSSIQKAAQLAPDNTVYKDIAERFRQKIISKAGVCLQGDGGAINIDWRWPIHIGRGEACHLHLRSPLVSRMHIKIIRNANGYLAQPSDPNRRFIHDGTEVTGSIELSGAGALSVGGISVAYATSDSEVILTTDDESVRVPRGAAVCIDERLSLRFVNGMVSAEPSKGLELNGDPIEHATLLMDGDSLQAIASYTVQARSD